MEEQELDIVLKLRDCIPEIDKMIDKHRRKDGIEVFLLESKKMSLVTMINSFNALRYSVFEPRRIMPTIFKQVESENDSTFIAMQGLY